MSRFRPTAPGEAALFSLESLLNRASSSPPEPRLNHRRFYSRKSILTIVSLMSIYPQIRQLDVVTRNRKQYIDGFVGELTFQERLLRKFVRDEIGLLNPGRSTGDDWRSRRARSIPNVRLRCRGPSGFGKSTPPQNRQLNIWISDSKQ